MLNHDFNINNDDDNHGMYFHQLTIIKVAAAYDHTDIVKLLLHRDVHVGRTLCFIIRNAQHQVMQLLLAEKPEILIGSYIDETTFEDRHEKFYSYYRHRERSEASPITVAVE